MSFAPTEHQQAIIDAGQRGDSLSIHAAAGAAKTTTIKLLVNAGLPHRKVLALAFNKRIAEDLAAALPKHVIVKTLNSLGHSAWAQQRGTRLELDARKIGGIVTRLYDPILKADDSGELWTVIRDGVEVARQAGAVPAESKNRPLWTGADFEQVLSEYLLSTTMPDDADPEFVASAIRATLLESISLAFQGTIDFTDQIYMTTCFRAMYSQFDCVIVDEAQDLSPANHRQLMLCRPKQLIAVGDPKQAIYAFRGADSRSMANLEAQWEHSAEGRSIERLPLPVSFRCPKAVVARQLRHYPTMEAFPSNREGIVEHLDQWSVSDLRQPCAIICRNNAPLVAAAFTLLAQGQGFTFFGQDMGKTLKSLIKKIANAPQRMSVAKKRQPSSEILQLVEVFFENEKAALRERDRPDLIAGLIDKVSCARIVLRNSKTLGEALEYCDEVFNAMDPGITLTSGHRSKGFEWSSVYHLDAFRIPSKFAMREADAGNPGPLEQERNLRYVIETRTSDYLGFIMMNKNTDGVPVELEEEA